MTAPIIGWARVKCDHDPKHHAIISRDTGGSVLTACAGRWPIADTLCFHLGVQRNPGAKCPLCAELADRQIARAELRRTMTYAPVEYPGIYELSAPPIGEADDSASGGH